MKEENKKVDEEIVISNEEAKSTEITQSIIEKEMPMLLKSAETIEIVKEKEITEVVSSVRESCANIELKKESKGE